MHFVTKEDSITFILLRQESDNKIFYHICGKFKHFGRNFAGYSQSPSEGPNVGKTGILMR